MLFCNRDTALAVDDMLASMNSYGAGGTSYGVFNNSEDMALNLGFMGFRRGSYDFYKSDWKYLNDFATRGAINALDTVGAVTSALDAMEIHMLSERCLITQGANNFMLMK